MLFALALQGVPAESVILVVGSNSVNLKVDFFEECRKAYLGPDLSRLTLDLSTLEQTTRRGLAYGKVIAESENYRPLQAACRSLLRARFEMHIFDRVLEFVRALEALLLPPAGNIQKTFANRSQTFVKGNGIHNDLSSIYKLRNAVAHYLQWDELVFPSFPQNVQFQEADKLIRRLDLLTSNTITAILDSPELIERFRSRQSVESFWTLSDCERYRVWGTPQDLLELEERRMVTPEFRRLYHKS